MDIFFEEAIIAAKKHFAKEWLGPLLHFAVAGEKETSGPFCKWLVEGSTSGFGKVKSTVHDVEIDLDDMIKFFSEQNTTRASIQEMLTGIGCWGSVVAIANGGDLWDETCDDTAPLRKYAKERILPLASSTHRVEAMVRECSHVASTNRGEDARSNYIFLRSIMNSVINDIAAMGKENRVLRANGSMHAGVQGQRVVRSEEARRKHGGAVEDESKVRKRARGAERVAVSLKVITDRYKEVARMDPSRRKEVKKQLLQKENKAKQERLEKKAVKFVANKDNSRRKNKRESERGVDRTFRMAGYIPYKKTWAQFHMEQLRAEVNARIEGDGDFVGGYQVVVKKLKELEAAAGRPTKKGFKPLTDYFRHTYHHENAVLVS